MHLQEIVRQSKRTSYVNKALIAAEKETYIYEETSDKVVYFQNKHTKYFKSFNVTASHDS